MNLPKPRIPKCMECGNSNANGVRKGKKVVLLCNRCEKILKALEKKKGAK